MSASGRVKFNFALIERPNDGATFSRVSTISTRRRQQFLAFMLWEDNGVFVCDWRACYSIELNYCSFFIVKVYIFIICRGEENVTKFFSAFDSSTSSRELSLKCFVVVVALPSLLSAQLSQIEIENCWYRHYLAVIMTHFRETENLLEESATQ